METFIYYIYPEYIDQITENNEDKYLELVEEGKGVLYESIEVFAESFNEGYISDLGMIQSFNQE